VSRFSCLNLKFAMSSRMPAIVRRSINSCGFVDKALSYIGHLPHSIYCECYLVLPCSPLGHKVTKVTQKGVEPRDVSEFCELSAGLPRAIGAAMVCPDYIDRR
jgi:hypothetical protein